MHRQIRRMLVIIVTIGLMVQPVFVEAAPAIKAVKPNPLYAQIKELYLPAIGIVAEDETAKQPVETKSKTEEKPDLTIKPLTIEQKKNIAFDVLAYNDKNVVSPLLSRHSWLDMELFENANLAQAINRTNSAIGEAVLAKMLVADRKSDPTIAQAAIKELINNSELFEKLDRSLKIFARTEDVFLKNYQTEDPIFEKHFDSLYYLENTNLWNFTPVLQREKSWKNESPVFLEVGNRIHNLLNAGYVSGLEPISAIIYSLAGKFVEFAGAPGEPAAFARNLCFPLVSVYSCLSTLLRNNSDNFALFDPVPKKATAIVVLAISLALWTVMGRQGYKELAKYHDCTQYLQSKLLFTSAAMRSLQDCYARCAKVPALRKAVPELEAIKHFLAGSSKKAQELQSLLDTDTFKGQPSFWSYHGRVLVAHQLMQEIKYEWRNALEALGTLDAYVSVAKLYKEFEGTKTPYCFVEFSQQDTPYINATNFWNPQVDPKHAIPNTIELGRTGSNRNMVLTGQNTAGKSTALRALLHCTLLGQAFGIAPAQAMVMTPFKSIFTHIIVRDDTAKGVSLYKAEVNQMRDMQKLVRQLNYDEFCLVVMDEVFRSTSEQQAAILARDCSMWLAEYPNVMVIQSTHKPELVKLEDETKGLYKNYKMEIIKQDHGVLYRPYKIEQGFTTTNVAAEILAEEGVDFGNWRR